jgi:hypothetical protein
VLEQFATGLRKYGAYFMSMKGSFQGTTIILLILPILFLTGCLIASSSTITPFVPIPPPVLLSETPTPTFYVAPTFTETLPPVPTLSATPVPTITQTIPPSSTPWPSLTFLPTVTNPLEAVRQLYGTNGGCKLPCWWGITPGKTSIELVQQFFQQFAAGGVIVEEDEDQSIAKITYPPANDSQDVAVSTRLYINSHIIEGIILDYEAVMWGGFSPRRMITEYGRPEQVSFNLTNDLSYLTFFYSKKHIVVGYQYSIEKNGNEKKACLIGFDALATWSTEDIPSMILEYFPLDSIEWLSQMDSETFYNALKGSGTNLCFSMR